MPVPCVTPDPVGAGHGSASTAHLPAVFTHPSAKLNIDSCHWEPGNSAWHRAAPTLQNGPLAFGAAWECIACDSN